MNQTKQPNKDCTPIMNIAWNQACVQNKRCCEEDIILTGYSPCRGHHHQSICVLCGNASCPAWVPRMIKWDNGSYTFVSQNHKETPLEPATCFSLTSAFTQHPEIIYIPCTGNVPLSHQPAYIFSWKTDPRGMKKKHPQKNQRNSPSKGGPDQEIGS